MPPASRRPVPLIVPMSGPLLLVKIHLGTERGEGLTVCKRDLDWRQVGAQKTDIVVVFYPGCPLKSHLVLKKIPVPRPSADLIDLG